MAGIPLFDLMLLALGVLILVTVPVILTTQARRRRLDRRIAGLHDAGSRGVPAVAAARQPVRITLGQPDGRWPAAWKAVAVCFGYIGTGRRRPDGSRPTRRGASRAAPASQRARRRGIP